MYQGHSTCLIPFNAVTAILAHTSDQAIRQFGGVTYERCRNLDAFFSPASIASQMRP